MSIFFIGKISSASVKNLVENEGKEGYCQSCKDHQHLVDYLKIGLFNWDLRNRCLFQCT
jgi:hypothetical protein